MIKAIFFARFHETKGSKVLHQVPAGAIVPSVVSPANSVIAHGENPLPLPQQAPLFDFNSISQYIIPRPAFCDRPLTICINKLRIVSHPVCIDDLARYDRKIYIFNFAIVIEEDVEMSGYVSVVRKLARLFRNLEEMNGFLSQEEELLEETDRSSLSGSRNGRGKVHALCEMIMEDLNNYCECMIPIDDANTVNLKLFPPQPPPPPVPAYVVPLLTITLPYQTISTDLTLLRVLPHINGINSVARISELADVDLSLTRKSVQHLLYYGCVLLLDIFQFGAIYAPTSEISSFVEDDETVREGLNYITLPEQDCLSFPSKADDSDHCGSLRGGASDADSVTQGSPPYSRDSQPEQKGKREPLDPTTLIQLYTSLSQGKTLRTWVLEHEDLLRGVDVRRMITFGIIKGFLYRVHKYVVATGASGRSDWDRDGHASVPQSTLDAVDTRATNVVRGFATPRSARADGQHGAGPAGTLGMGLPLAKYVDGTHCFDEICTELKMGEREVMATLRETFGEILIIHR